MVIEKIDAGIRLGLHEVLVNEAVLYEVAQKYSTSLLRDTASLADSAALNKNICWLRKFELEVNFIKTGGERVL